MGRFLSKEAAVVLAVLAFFAAGCHPKAQTRGAGNAAGIVFAVNPPDAEVILDGIARGKAAEFAGERRLEAESGTHRLELRKPGYETYARDVYVSNALLRIEAILMPGGVAPAE